MGIAQAEHEESAPTADALVISRLSCSLVGSTQIITLQPDTLTYRIYGQTTVAEEFACNYGLNARYQAQFQNSELCMVGTDADDEVRMVELRTHPFFLATLFLPQMRSSAAQPHPLIMAYIQATLNAQ